MHRPVPSCPLYDPPFQSTGSSIQSPKFWTTASHLHFHGMAMPCRACSYSTHVLYTTTDIDGSAPSRRVRSSDFPDFDRTGWMALVVRAAGQPCYSAFRPSILVWRASASHGQMFPCRGAPHRAALQSRVCCTVEQRVHVTVGPYPQHRPPSFCFGTGGFRRADISAKK